MARKRRHVSRSHKRANKSFFTPFRVVFVSLSILALITIFSVTTNRSTRTVLGVATSSYRSAVINWSLVQNALGYNIYYKQQSDKDYIFAVRNLPSTATNYTVNYLKKNTPYMYVVKAYNSSGKEFWSSGQKWIWNYK